MSILPFTILPALGVTMLSINIATQDVTYTRDTASGIDLQGSPTSRTVSGCVEVNGKKLEQIFGGPVSEGDIGIVLTTQVLYFLDAFATGDVRRQSFVTHQGTQYRVTKVADWGLQTGTKVYLAERHLVQDTI